MNKTEQAIKIIENDQPMDCACRHCKGKRWAYEMALAALREQAEREKGCDWCEYFERNNQHLVPRGNGMYDDLRYAVCPMCGKRLEVEE